MSRFIAKIPRPLFRRTIRKAPGHPHGNRVVVREHAPETVTEGGLEIAEKARGRLMAGTIIAVGDQAADKLYDLGAEIGDEVWFAQYAGLIEEWQHVVGGDVESCAHAGTWDRVTRDDEEVWGRTPFNPTDDNVSLRQCSSCGTIKASERVLVMSGEDIIVNVDIQERLESGALQRRRGVNAEGQTRYYIARQGVQPDSFEIDPNAEARRAAVSQSTVTSGETIGIHYQIESRRAE